jgi:ABC-type dipeptide/oligopeptide/nickel transport system ATPase subunit
VDSNATRLFVDNFLDLLKPLCDKIVVISAGNFTHESNKGLHIIKVGSSKYTYKPMVRKCKDSFYDLMRV